MHCADALAGAPAGFVTEADAFAVVRAGGIGVAGGLGRVEGAALVLTGGEASGLAVAVAPAVATPPWPEHAPRPVALDVVPSLQREAVDARDDCGVAGTFGLVLADDDDLVADGVVALELAVAEDLVGVLETPP